MSLLRIRLVYREAVRRRKDAEVLRTKQAIDAPTDSAYLLEGMELMLKLVYELALGKRAPTHHKYREIFEALPVDRQSRVLTLAGERIGPSLLETDPGEVLADLSTNFVSLRYPYEAYRDLTEEQYRQFGIDWLSRGGPLDEATFRYHPEELLGLAHGPGRLAREVVPPGTLPDD